LPQDVPGYGNLEARRAQFRSLLAAPELKAAVSADIAKALEKHGVRQEPAAQAGLTAIRRARGDGHDYFFVNLGDQPFDGWLQLANAAGSALIMDPLTGTTGAAATQVAPRGALRVYLQLASGESTLVRTHRMPPKPPVQPWRYLKATTGGVTLRGPWQLEFIRGGPVLPGPANMAQLSDWTSLADPATQRFSGTARYRIEFDAPAGAADEWLLDLGDVRESARVRLNGRDLGTAWSLPFRARLGGALQARGNTLEIEVTNLPANRIRDLDVRKAPWKIMRDAGIVSVKYRPFDAAGWDVEPSGLRGPVLLVPMEIVSPR
jgi:hypothetical protein